jgi:hypothetical protein
MIKKLRITSILYTCLKGAYQVAKGRVESRRTAQASNRRQSQTQQEHPEIQIPDRGISHEPNRFMRWVYVSVI